MKKTLIITAILLFVMNAEAQDYYSAGYYEVNNGTIAALYKNNERVYTAHYTNRTSKAIKVACNSQRDVFWMVYHYNYPSNTLSFTEIRKNNQVYASTENLGEIYIYDMYCLEDTLYYAGYQLNENGIAIATVWKGEEFTTHWVLGDGIHASVIYDAEVDKNTNIPYFCGYVSDSLHKASVWEASQLLYKQEPSGSQRASWAKEISIDNGSIYTNGYLNYYTGYETVSIPTIWKDNVRIDNGSGLDFIDCLYAQQGDFYYTFFYPHGMYYAVYKNRSEILQLPLDNQTGVQRICGDLDDIYMVGVLQGQGCIWKNFEVYLQPNNCDYICDMVVSYASVSVDETNENGFAVYPNPTNNILFVQTLRATSLPAETYRITNLMGQTLLQGQITAETQQINIENLPAGLYFISVDDMTQKFVVK